MNATDDGLTEADRRYREWMQDLLGDAAAHFDLVIDDAPVFGWMDRSIGAPARYGTEPRWLRVVTENPQWACGDTWNGTLDANVLTGFAKPRVLASHEWRNNPYRSVRVEVMTRLLGKPCSVLPTPSDELTMPATWWNLLVSTLERLRVIDTNRVSIDQSKVDHRMHMAFGTTFNVSIRQWETVHGDLHWGNLFRDPFGIADWEFWGTGPAGTDPATLYLYSLAAPRLRETVHHHFAYILDTPDGRRAQLYVAARLLHRTTFGDHPELVKPLRTLVSALAEG